MFIFYFILIYIVVVFLGLFSHAILPKRLYKNDSNSKNLEYWEKIRKRYQTCGSYELKKREIEKLYKPSMLTAFHDVYIKTSKEEVLKFIIDNRESLLKIGKTYRNSLVRAYYADLLSSFQINAEKLSIGFDDLMLGYLTDHSVYVRQNALKALYSFGKPEKVVDAFILLSKNYIYHNEKLLADGLMTFNGNKEKLAENLMNCFFEMNACYQVAVVNYLTYMEEHRYDSQFRWGVEVRNTSLDVACCLLRCLGRVKSEENKKLFLEILRKHDYNGNDWEMAAVAANLLATYEGDSEVVSQLRYSITSENWYVRMNSAKTLIGVGISEEVKNQILTGKDTFAKDALVYAMKAAQEQKN